MSKAGSNTDAAAADESKVELTGMNLPRSQAEYLSAPPGKTTDRNAPNTLIEIGRGPGREKGSTDVSLQAAHVSYDSAGRKHTAMLTGEIGSQEHLVPYTSKGVQVVGLNTSEKKGFVPGAKGVITDHLDGLHVKNPIHPNAQANGTAILKQTYKLWYEGNTYNLPITIYQIHTFRNSQDVQTLEIHGP